MGAPAPADKARVNVFWQISGRSDLDFETKVSMGIDYIEGWRLWFDFVVLVKTIPAVLTCRGAY